MSADGTEKRTHRINIRSLVEQIHASGSLAAMSPDFSSAVEGTRIHKKYQQREMPGVSNYKAEVQFEHAFEGMHLDLLVSGKADGMYTAADAKLHIEEIKTLKHTLADYPENGIPVHWAQLKMYGWFYCLQEQAERVTLDLIYFRRRTDEERFFSGEFSVNELERECRPWVEQILNWLDRIEQKRLSLAGQIKQMDFPFEDFRPGQREFAKYAYRGIRDGKAVYLQAATGIGKTMAAVFSAAKALSEEFCEKVFFLTAKNSGAIAAEQALKILNRQKIEINWISITAKAKICFLLDSEDGRQRPPCDPELCPFAKDYFDKLPTAMEELFFCNGFSRAKIEELAEKHKVCPFEYSLDLALFCDYVIADYNYAFDYGASLKRFFRQGKVPFVLLVDEAHNLVDRARDMFSSTINKKKVLEYKRGAKEPEKKIMAAFNAWLLKLRKMYDQWTEEAYEDYPDGLEKQISSALEKLDGLIQQGASLSAAAFDFYWELSAAKLVLEQYDASYRTIIKAGTSTLVISLQCIDPSGQIETVLKNQQAAVFFSATFRPFSYFVSLLSPNLESECHELLSGFPGENVLYLVNSKVSTRWKTRETNLPRYRDIVLNITAHVQGNLIVFSPSFSFQETLLEQLALVNSAPSSTTHDVNGTDKNENTDTADCGNENTELKLPDNYIVQQRKMEHQEKQDFMNDLSNPERSTIGFCVIGGSYAESIDLLGDRLIGVIIFGLGLPQVNVYTKTLKEYFDKRGENGYNYAYVYPGINRILQAAGRVIRSDTDKGFIYLVDDRYGSSLYRGLFPEAWDVIYERDYEESLGRISRLLETANKQLHN